MHASYADTLTVRQQIQNGVSIFFVLVIGYHTKAANAAARVLALPWMRPKSTTSFIF